MTAPVEVDVASLGPLRQIGSGGQGKVFALVNAPDGGVYKEYSPRVVDDLDVDALHRFVQFGRNLTDSGREALLARVAWPEVVVRRDSVVRGFLMPRIPPGFTVEMRFGDQVTRENAAVQFLLNPAAYLTERGLRISDRFRLELLRDTADTLTLFHQLGIAVGDLSPNNLLFSLAGRPRCFFIDCDAMRLGGDSVLAQTETPDWQVGAIGDEELGTPASDAYKFGLLAVRLFAADQQSRQPAAVPVRLRRRVIASLSADPDERDPPSAWLRPLDKLIEREPEFRPEPLPPRAEPAEPEQPEIPEPVRAAPVVLPVPAPRRRGWAWAGIASIAIAVIFGIATSNDNSGTGVGPGAQTLGLPTPGYPLPTGVGGLGDYPLPTDLYPNLTPPAFPTLGVYPSYVCLFSSAPGPGVKGGDGLTQATGALGGLTCDVNRAVGDKTAPAGKVWAPLRGKAPYLSSTVTGFFGEGTAGPRATVNWTADDGCWTGTVRFTRGYEIASVGPLSPCG
ncbi:MAG TPA: hypothetical protein VGP16_10965 [Asanoa sp.]|nr:hypothetical protein [Asanoa sp.]